MNNTMPDNLRPNWLVLATTTLFAVGLVAVGVLRYFGYSAEEPPALAQYATLIYIGLTVVAVIVFVRTSVPTNGFGFRAPAAPGRILMLAMAGVVIIQVVGLLLDPVLAFFVDAERDLSRFSGIAGSPGALAQLLVQNWTVAAFGEELAFRIVLMRGIAYGLGDSRTARIIALALQAIVFGLIHMYQGPAGIAGSMVNGMIFAVLVLLGRGSIWPAALAHGASNTIGILQLYSAG
jgi:membrane protease YdiL (CAAX protease family)